MSKQQFILIRPDIRERAIAAVKAAPDGYVCTISEPTRNSAQNALMWACLQDIAEQVEWYGKKLTPEDWKHIFSSSLRRLEVVPNLDGTGFVALGQSTSAMTKREFGDLCDLIFSFGAEKGVRFSEQAA